MFNM
ncbi:uncharacterized protein CPUR_04665 [Claviceps purpurea 20.1]